MIRIYTDGGCSGNPGPGGWAFVIIMGTGDQGLGTGELNSLIPDTPFPIPHSLPPSPQSPVPSPHLAEKWGAERSTTNNRMELKAVIAALEELAKIGPGEEKVTVYTDSQYVQKGMTIWMADWKKKGWKTSSKGQVKNLDLWQRLDALAAGFNINWAWVKGHSGEKYNEYCDDLTQKAIASLQ